MDNVLKVADLRPIMQILYPELEDEKDVHEKMSIR